MATVVLLVHLILAIALVGVVLLQRSEGGGLGMGGGGGGGMGGFMTGRGTANLLTRMTAVLAACFMGTSLFLAILASGSREPTSIFDRAQPPAAEQPVEEPAVPADPDRPSVPLAR